MKRILATIIALLSVLLALPVSAVEKDIEDIIYDEIIQAVDIKNYPALLTDSEIYLLRLMETGYGEKGFESGSALYLYLYNPSCKEITASELNSVQMATAWDDEGMPTDFKKYGLTIEGSALNGLYIRAKVNVSAKTLATLVDGTRRYGITEFELHENGKYNAKAYEEGYIYEFSGYGDSLKCTKTDFLTLTLDVHQTSYIFDGKSKPSVMAIDYQNQLNSVYFSVPQKVEEAYGNLYSIKYEYTKTYTNPIIVTTNKELSDQLKDHIENGSYISDLYLCTSKAVGLYTGLPDSLYAQYPFGKAKDEEWWDSYQGCITLWRGEEMWTDGNFYLPALVYLVNEFVEDQVVVSSETLQSDFIEYSKKDITSPLFKGKYSYDLLDQYSEWAYLGDYVEEVKTRDDLFDVEDWKDGYKWYELPLVDWLSSNETVTDVPYFEKVTYKNTLSSTFGEDYLVSDIDIDGLSNYCKEAENNEEIVYILRYALTDDYASSNMSYEGCGNNGGLATDTFMFQTSVYCDFDIIQLAFGNDPENLTVFGVVSSPTDGFVDVTPPKKDEEEFDWEALFRKILAIVMIFVAVLVIVWLIGKLGEIGQAKTNREIRKYLKNQNKNQNRRK